MTWFDPLQSRDILPSREVNDMVRLYLEDDAGNVRIIPMEAEEVSIGRAEDNTIVLPDRNVSRHHARLKAVNGRFYVEDAGARYGLFLNGSRVDGRREVRPGDLITLGDYKVKVLPESAEGEKAPKPPSEEELRSLGQERDAHFAKALQLADEALGRYGKEDPEIQRWATALRARIEGLRQKDWLKAKASPEEKAAPPAEAKPDDRAQRESD